MYPFPCPGSMEQDSTVREFTGRAWQQQPLWGHSSCVREAWLASPGPRFPLAVPMLSTVISSSPPLQV